MAHLLLTCRLSPTEATIEAAARHLGVDASAIDTGFGVVLIDPADERYAVMVDERVVQDARTKEGVEGPFANPRIEPFGPPERAPDPEDPEDPG